MKANPHISALHFSVIAFEWFCPQSFCLSERLAALNMVLADTNTFLYSPRYNHLLFRHHQILPDRHRFLPIAITSVAVPTGKRDAHDLAKREIKRRLRIAFERAAKDHAIRADINFP